MGEGMSLHGATRTSGPCARRHASHHRSALSHLRSSWSGHTGMDGLDHAGTGVGIWVLSGGHWMTGRQPRMLWDALMGRIWLRHHHRSGWDEVTDNGDSYGSV